MMALGKRTVLALIAAGLLALAPARAGWAWAHQGHILITRMACLRILDDQDAPEGLKAFIRANMKYDLAACEKLATEEMVGADPKNYQVGFDGAATLPDRIQGTDEGKVKLQPYGAPESKMHFLDMEIFSKDGVYKEDLSGKPKLADLPRDPKDPRYLQAGFVLFRIDECYKNTVCEFAKDKPAENPDALRWAGYLAHYIEDCHQPHHGTEDFKSMSYLAAAKIKGVHANKITTADGKEIVTYRADRSINPHGDVEFQLFENAEEPRKSLRAQYWKLLSADLLKLDSVQRTAAAAEGPFDGFAYGYGILDTSYDYLPLVGGASQAAYAKGDFDVAVFMGYKAKVHGEELSVLEMIALQNARAVVAVQHALKSAWADAHTK